MSTSVLVRPTISFHNLTLVTYPFIAHHTIFLALCYFSKNVLRSLIILSARNISVTQYFPLYMNCHCFNYNTLLNKNSSLRNFANFNIPDWKLRWGIDAYLIRMYYLYQCVYRKSSNESFKGKLLWFVLRVWLRDSPRFLLLTTVVKYILLTIVQLLFSYTCKMWCWLTWHRRTPLIWQWQLESSHGICLQAVLFAAESDRPADSMNRVLWHSICPDGKGQRSVVNAPLSAILIIVIGKLL